MELIVPVRGSEAGDLAIPVMHPLHCLQSRIANVVTLGRTDAVAMRQLAAAPIVLEAYIDEMLRLGDTSEATATLQNLFEFLRSDIAARACPRLPMRDPAELIGTFIKDRRIDWRFRWFNLRSMRHKLRNRRQNPRS